MRLSKADIGKLERLLGYQPVCGVHEGLERTIDWYLANLNTQPRRVANA